MQHVIGIKYSVPFPWVVTGFFFMCIHLGYLYCHIFDQTLKTCSSLYMCNNGWIFSLMKARMNFRYFIEFQIE
jgi:hypothetical protein